jgi:hypothetical protein
MFIAMSDTIIPSTEHANLFRLMQFQLLFSFFF